MVSFPAQYKGICVPCGDGIEPGEYITNHPEYGYIHEECTDVVPVGHTEEPRHNRAAPPTMPRGKTAADRCDRCFMIHATTQTECY